MKAVFLDRDGVLNRVVLYKGKPHPPASVAELDILPGVPEALDRLKAAGFKLLVVTNQPDVARGKQLREHVEAINERLLEALTLDEIFVCYEDGDTPRRKPNPGLLLEAAVQHGVDPGVSFMVGDRWKDIEAGRRAGCRTCFLDAGYDEARPNPPADHTTTSLASAVTWILAHGTERKETSHGL